MSPDAKTKVLLAGGVLLVGGSLFYLLTRGDKTNAPQKEPSFWTGGKHVSEQWTLDDVTALWNPDSLLAVPLTHLPANTVVTILPGELSVNGNIPVRTGQMTGWVSPNRIGRRVA